MKNFILASKSPRRIELLKQIGYKPKEIISSNIAETPLKKELPKDFVLRMAVEKAKDVHSKYPNDYVLGADTIVVFGRKILQKAYSDEDVKNFLKALSGRRHRVYTGICLISLDSKISKKIVETIVKFKRLDNLDIKEYTKSKEGLEKAGGYAIQGLGGAFVSWISGSYSNVVGLPLYETRNLLKLVK
ncbi:Maf family protein [Pseudomonadota bacterium]